jgi:hypothetical protein
MHSSIATFCTAVCALQWLYTVVVGCITMLALAAQALYRLFVQYVYSASTYLYCSVSTAASWAEHVSATAYICRWTSACLFTVVPYCTLPTTKCIRFTSMLPIVACRAGVPEAPMATDDNA